MQKLPNEIIINIIEKYVYSNSYGNYIKLTKISKLFKYYCEKIMYKKSIKIVNKYIKRNRFNLLYRKSNGFKCIRLLIEIPNSEIFSFDIRKMILSEKNIRETQLPSYIKDYSVYYDNTDKYFGNVRSMTNQYDILQSIIVRGKNIKKIVIIVNNDPKCCYYYNNNDMVTIYLANGIYGPALMYINIFIQVYAENCTNIYTYGKMLNYNDILPHTSINIIKENIHNLSKLEQDLYII